MQSILLIIVVVTATLISIALGNSTGTGSCDAGVASIENTNPTNTHIQYAGYPGSTSTRPGARGTLNEAAIIVEVNGQQITPGTPATFPVGTALTWEVTAAAVGFKGIFVRVEKSSDDFTNVPGDATLQNSAFCDAIAGVVGVTHVSSAVKTASSGTMTFDSAGDATVDITLVFDNIANSIYAFDSFTLTLADSGTPTTSPPVEGPVDAPVDTPVTAAPTAVGVPTVTDPPVAAPVGTDPPVDGGVPTTEPPTADAPTSDECPEDEGKSKKGKGKGEGKGKGDGSSKSKGGMMMGMKCKKTPKEPKTPKAGKGKGDDASGKGKGGDATTGKGGKGDDSA